MKKSDWGIEIVRVENGFLIQDNAGNRIAVEEKEDDELSAGEKLLWEVVSFFNLRPSRFKRESIRVIREVGDKYAPQKGERIIKEYFFKVVRVGSKKPKKRG